MKVARYRVKELAKVKGLTQFDLATKSGVSLTVVQRLWQNHKALGDVRYSTLDAISKALDVTIEDLFVDGAEGQVPSSVNNESRMAAAA